MWDCEFSHEKRIPTKARNVSSRFLLQIQPLLKPVHRRFLCPNHCPQLSLILMIPLYRKCMLHSLEILIIIRHPQSLLANSFNSCVNTGSNSGAMIWIGTLIFSISLFSRKVGCAVEIQSTRSVPFSPRRNIAQPPSAEAEANRCDALVPGAKSFCTLKYFRLAVVLAVTADETWHIHLPPSRGVSKISKGKASPPKLFT